MIAGTTHQGPDSRASWPLRVAWTLLTLAALGVGIVSLRYLLPTVPFPGVPGNWELHRRWVIVHATFASLAILIGPWQFLKPKGGTRRVWHRWFGRGYLLAVLIGWISSVPIAANAQAGVVARAGFLTLGLVWIMCSALAYFTIRRHQVQAHRRWMVRSYALTCAAISLRIMISRRRIGWVRFRCVVPSHCMGLLVGKPYACGSLDLAK